MFVYKNFLTLLIFLVDSTRNNIEGAPSTLSQAAWSAAGPLSVAPQTGSVETNEKQNSVKKDIIPAAPAVSGASSFPLQLNKHSPGDSLIKRFFIAKKEGTISFCIIFWETPTDICFISVRQQIYCDNAPVA